MNDDSHDSTRRLVTIVIPVYNRLQYLEQAIESALAQTHRAIDLIVVDDGSPLDPGPVTSRYGLRVHLIRKPNGGLASAPNAGIRHARGSYVFFLDGDDDLEPGAVEALVAALRWRLLFRSAKSRLPVPSRQALRSLRTR